MECQWHIYRLPFILFDDFAEMQKKKHTYKLLSIGIATFHVITEMEQKMIE